MAQVLEMLHLAQQDGVSQMQIGGGGVEPDLDGEGFLFLAGLDESAPQFLLVDHFGATLEEIAYLPVNRPFLRLHKRSIIGDLVLPGRAVPQTQDWLQRRQKIHLESEFSSRSVAMEKSEAYNTFAL